MFITVKVDVGNLKSEYDSYVEECKNDPDSMVSDEIETFEEYFRIHFEEWESKIGGKIDNFSYFSIKSVEHTLVDDDGTTIVKKL